MTDSCKVRKQSIIQYFITTLGDVFSAFVNTYRQFAYQKDGNDSNRYRVNVCTSSGMFCVLFSLCSFQRMKAQGIWQGILLVLVLPVLL